MLSAGCGSSEASQEPSREDRGEAPAADAASYPIPEVAREIEPSVVQVNVSTIQTTPYGPQEAEGLGSGVVYREDGHIITNAHVVGGARTVNVAFADGSVEPGRVLGSDPYTDIAVVKVDREDAYRPRTSGVAISTSGSSPWPWAAPPVSSPPSPPAS